MKVRVTGVYLISNESNFIIVDLGFRYDTEISSFYLYLIIIRVISPK